MLIRIRFCLFLSILFSFLTGHAGEHFRLYSNKPQVQAELVEIENRIPLVVRQTIARPIKIKFKELDKNSKIYFGCERELKNIETSIAARVNTLFKIQDISEIEVHTGYLHELQKNPHRQVCGASVSTHFARAVTHEIIHIFDASISPSADEIKYTKRYCVRRGPQGRSSSQTQTGLCKNIKRKWRYSNSVRFLNLDNWSTTRSTKNVLQQNALDPYVFTNARESFAVQAEAFLYDPTFACHKPAMSSYYSEIFNVEPLGGHCKDLNTTIFSRNQKIDLDPSRLYQVHYLFAAKGEELSSRWGHAMLRLVFCAPERMQVDEKCLNDVSRHYVISFRADIDDFELDNIKGLTGKYPSQMFVLNLDEVVKEYTQIELRDLKSLPLRLNEKEKEQFINKVLETYWSYRGRYYFLSNNCADETFSLLAGIFGDKYQFAMQKFAFQDATLVMPGELYSFYLETGLAEPPSSNIAEQVSKGHLFESAQKKVKLAYSVISSDRSASTLKKYLNESQASERKVNFELMVSDSPQNQTKLASAYYVLESYFLIRKQSQMRKNLAQKIYEKDPEILNLYAEAKIQFSDTIENEILNLEYDGYGVPLARDQERFTRQNQKSNFSEDEFLSQIESVLPGDMAEVNAIRENLKLFIKKTIKTKQHNP